ncbi:MAG TPA: hypothetical protein VJX94_28095 [Stellaceae bacterium]|nr:hypothetical protein [Stellaceae bacterium]
MRIGFLFWPFVPDLVRRLTESAERLGYDMIGIADTPGRWLQRRRRAAASCDPTRMRHGSSASSGRMV